MQKNRIPFRSERNKMTYQIRMLMKHNRDGTPDRQSARHQNLIRCARQLQERGYGSRWNLHKIGRREVHRLVDTWRKDGISHRTIANRMVDIRWLAERVGRADQIPTNRELGIPRRTANTVNKSRELDHLRLRELGIREQLVTELRREFGLRSEEAIKFSYAYACPGASSPSSIQLKGSWCKGGRPREIPVVTERQQMLLRRVRDFQEQQPPGKNPISMIPTHMKFRSYYRNYHEACRSQDIPGHALRHCWAQERFESLSGIECPLDGGPKYADLSPADQHRWDHAAATVNHELGHGKGRLDITATYIGSR